MSKANPLQLYNAIVHTRQMNPLSPGRNVEAHHVIPKSLGGSDDDWNRVNLTKDEHEMEFDSVKEAAKSIGSAPNLISTRLRQNKPCKGYTLRYKEAM